MPFERIMGIEVTDETEYHKYREAMTPLLESVGGYFGFDFKVAEVLKSETDDKINRVFTITFPCEATMNKFFTSEDYLAIKKRYFDGSVGKRTVISLHEKHISRD